MPKSVIPVAAAAIATYYLGPAGLKLSPFFAAVGGAVAGGVVAQSIASKPSGEDLTREASTRITTVRQPAAPWQWIYGEVRVGGVMTFAEVSANNAELNLVITLAGHAVEEIGDIYFDDEVVPVDDSGVVSGRFAGYAYVAKSKGDEASDVQPFPVLVAKSAGKWTNAHKQTGRAKIYVNLNWNQDLFPNGIPNISAVVKGRKVYDPRTGLTAWSANAALCMTDFLTASPTVGLGCVYASEIDEAQTIAAANVCDEDIVLADGSTEKRFTMNGAFSVDGAPRGLLGRMNTAHGGYVRQLSGRWAVYPAVYATPEATALTADDLRGALRIQPRITRRELCNGVKGIFVSPENGYQPTDYPPVTNATYLEEDQGERIWRDVDRPFTSSAAAAQRLGKIELERVRQQISVQWPGKLTCYRLQPGDVVPVSLDKYGWSSKVFEVVSSTLVFEEDGAGVRLGCDLVLRETAAAVFDWNSGEETAFDPAPDSNLPDPFTVAPPGAPALTEALYETRDGRGVAVKAVVSWAAAADAFVERYQLEYRVAGDTTWIVRPPVPGLSQEILDVEPGRYDFRVKSVNVLGVSSTYTSSLNREVVGLGAAPSDPEILGLQVAGGLAYLSLAPHPDLDVRRGGRWRVRFVHEGLAVAWDAGFSIGEPDTYMGDQTNLVLPLKPGVYMVRAEDSGGVQSDGFAFIETKQASVLTYTSLATVQEDSAFSGTLDGTVAAAGVLTLGGTGVIDDASDFDAIDNLDFLGGNALEGTYTFAASHDFGAMERVRLTGRIEGTIVNNKDLIDDRLGELDDWLDFDGSNETAGSSADAFIEMRETDDDPAGSPIWSAWKRLDASEHEAWGVQYRAVLTTNDPAYRPEVTVLRVNAAQL